MSRAVCCPVAATAARLDIPPGQGTSSGHGHLHDPQPHIVRLRTAATSLRYCFALIIPFFAFPKFSSVFFHTSNPSLKSSSINQVQVWPQSSVPKNLNSLWQQVPNAAVLLLPFSWCCIQSSTQSRGRPARFRTLLTM